MDVIPLLPSMYDEPFRGSSQIPTYLVAKWRASTSRWPLSGDAGDELLAAMPRYSFSNRMLPTLTAATDRAPADSCEH